MSVPSVGDLRQFILTTRNVSAIKNDLNTLVQEMTTGEVSDLTAHLGPNQSKLAGVDRQLDMLDRFVRSNADLANMLGTMQTVLDAVSAQRETAGGALLTVNSASTPAQVGSSADIARTGFEATVAFLNTRFGDRSMFGGTALDAPSLASPDVILADIRSALTGLTGPADISNAIDGYFDTGGGFETSGYLGDDAEPLKRAVDASQAVTIDARADDPAVRDTLKAMALGAFAGDQTLELSDDARRTMQRQAGEALMGAAGPLAELQSRLGYVEGQVEQASVRIAAQQTSYGIARNEMVSADPFETATRLQSVQTQLETQFTLTARLSRLSLTEYLR